MPLSHVSLCGRRPHLVGTFGAWLDDRAPAPFEPTWDPRAPATDTARPAATGRSAARQWAETVVPWQVSTGPGTPSDGERRYQRCDHDHSFEFCRGVHDRSGRATGPGPGLNGHALPD